MRISIFNLLYHCTFRYWCVIIPVTKISHFILNVFADIYYNIISTIIYYKYYIHENILQYYIHDNKSMPLSSKSLLVQKHPFLTISIITVLLTSVLTQIEVEQGEAKTVPTTPTDEQRTIQQNALFAFYRQNDFVNLNQQFGFQINNGAEEFNFHLPTDHAVHFLIRIYVLKNNAYIQIPNVEMQPALHIVVYENNHKIVVEKSLYFQGTISINGKKGSTYMIRFYSSTPKLITITHNNFIQTSHLQGKVQNTKMQQNIIKVSSIDNKLNEIFKNLRFTYRMQIQSRTQFTNKTNRFINFQYVQMLLLVVVCLFQIKMVGKLFQSDSIV